jgi:hypothetical protein
LTSLSYPSNNTGHGLIKLLKKMWRIDDKTIHSSLSMAASKKGVKDPVDMDLT